jgi:hypothetical protein
VSRVSELARLLSLVLANPGAVVDGPADGLSPTDRLARLAPMLLVILCAGAALFGAAVGSHRGGIQALYAAMKMPLVFLLPGMVALPAIRVIAGGPHPCGHARASLAAAVGMARPPQSRRSCGWCSPSRWTTARQC